MGKPASCRSNIRFPDYMFFPTTLCFGSSANSHSMRMRFSCRSSPSAAVYPIPGYNSSPSPVYILGPATRLHLPVSYPIRFECAARSGLGPGPGWSPYGHIWALMGPYMGPYGPLWAFMGPPGQVLAGPDMSDFRLLVEFCIFWFQNLFVDKISK